MKGEKLATSSTRTNLKMLETKLRSIEKGHSLLKCKGDALNNYFKQIESVIKEKECRIGSLFKESFDMLSKARYFDADVNGFMEQCCLEPAKVYQAVDVKLGIEVINYSLDIKNIESKEWRGEYILFKMKESFNSLLRLLIEHSGEKRFYVALKSHMEASNKRKNALEHNLIPKLKITTKYIEDKMEELEREEFFRLKKMQTKKYATD